MSNKYLDILGLNPGASKEEVKKAYRRLSKIYHPDISKDEHAKEKFIEINEAYEFLTKVGPSPHQETVNYNYNPEVDEYAERRRKARARARKRAEEEAKLQEELTKRILKGFNYATLVILIFNLLLSIDYLLPRKIYHQKIIEASGNDEIRFTDFVMKFSDVDKASIIGYERISIEATPIFSKPMSVIIKVDNGSTHYNQSYNIYRVFGLVIPFTLLLALLYFFRARTINNKLSYAVALVFLILFQLFVFFTV